ncbi:MAG: GspE/PulE family protein [Candidatus Taylorbacteria bacterium]|nr:GspE/PulE family protein [Candidatus Taylorbacteria bacterium]
MNILKSPVAVVESIISNAGSENASDIHFEPYGEKVRVRLRVNGELRKEREFPIAEYSGVLARIKALASLRLDGISMQDGRFVYEVEIKAKEEGKKKILEDDLKELVKFDIRVSVLPSFFGESIVLRLFRRGFTSNSLIELGFTHEHEKVFKSALSGRGLIIITGPTGSGKTTTLYTLLQSLPIHELSIITLEDPIETTLEGIRQVQIHPRAGITFATGLRSILRQDPDVIMVGEIRDTETARIAVHASMTGHLVLSTIHTTSAVDAIPRLIDMGLEPYLIASSVRLIVAQELIKKVNKDGSIGRRVIAELLEFDNSIKNAVHNRKNTSAILGIASKNGFRTMENHILSIMEKGEITSGEAHSIIKNL